MTWLHIVTYDNCMQMYNHAVFSLSGQCAGASSLYTAAESI